MSGLSRKHYPCSDAEESSVATATRAASGTNFNHLQTVSITKRFSTTGKYIRETDDLHAIIVRESRNLNALRMISRPLFLVYLSMF